jgi:hypothetical protein
MAGVDWQAFATAFLGDTAKYINERKDKAEEYEQKQRDLAERNSSVLRQRQGIVDQVSGLASRAMNDLGATEEMVKAAIDSGPQGIQTLVQQLQDTKTSMGTRWTPEAAQAAITLPAGYTSAPNLSLDEYVRQAYGLPAATTGSYTAPESTWWDRAMGRNATDSARQRLDQEVTAGGYSIYDINDLASQAEYQSLVGGTYVNYVAPKVFNVENIPSELDYINNLVTDASNSPAIAAKEAEIARLEASLDNLPPAERPAVNAQINSLNNEINSYTQDRIRTGMMDRFGYYTAGGYMELMAPHIDQLVGQEGFTASAYNDFQEMMGLSEPTTEVPSPVVQTQAPELGDVAASIEASGGTAVVEGQNLVVQSDALRDALGSDDGKATITYDDAGQPTAFMFTMDGQEFIIDNPDDVAELVNTVAAVDTTPATARVGYSQPNLPDIAPEDMPIVPRQLISEEDSAAMTRAQRRALGLKESPLGRLLEFLPSEEERNRRLDQLDIKYSANPDEYYLVTIPGRNLNRPYRVKGENLQYIPDAVIARGYDNATIATMDTLEGTGRPPRILTSDQLTSIYAPSLFKAPEGEQPAAAASTNDGGPIADAPQKMTEEQMAEFEVAKAELENGPAPKQPIPADDMTEALLTNQGGVMINYLKDQGLNAESSPEELTIALMNFQQETGTQLPYDKTALVQILTQALAEGY